MAALRVGILTCVLLTIGTSGSAVDDYGAWQYGVQDGHLRAQRVIPTRDCGYLIVGRAMLSPGQQDFFAMKLDGMGTVEWAKAFGGPESEGPPRAAETGDGGFIVVGSTTSYGTGAPVAQSPWIVKLDENGDIERQRVYERPTTVSDIAGGVDGGGVLIVGSHRGDLWLLELMPSGDEIRQRTIGGPASEYASALATTPDGGLAICGKTDLVTPSDFWVLKLDSQGEIEWERAFGDRNNIATCKIDITPAGGYVLAATDNAPSTSRKDKVLIGLGPNGDLLWQSRFDIPFDENDPLEQIAGNTDGGAILATQWVPPWLGEYSQARLWRVDADGNLVWLQEYGEGSILNVELADVSLLGDGSLLLVGYRGSEKDAVGKSEVWLLRLDRDGLFGGDDCGLVGNAAPAQLPMDYRVTETSSTVTVVALESWDTGAVARDLQITRLEQCSSPACQPARCGDVSMNPAEVCEGDEVTLSLGYACGEWPLSVGWDLDGDGLPDELGMEVQVSLPAGTHTVDALVSDSCTLPGPGSCKASGRVTVLSSEPPAEVSGFSEPRLRVLPGGDRVVVSGTPGVVAYNVYADRLGSWYGPSAATGSACGLAGTVLPDDTVELDYAVPTGSWIVVNGSSRCAEGPAGPDSTGIERTTLGTWDLCGAVF